MRKSNKSHGINQEMRQAAISWKDEIIEMRVLQGEELRRAEQAYSIPINVEQRTFDRSGLASLIGESIKVFKEKTGVSLPWNMDRACGPWRSLPNRKWHIFPGWATKWAESFPEEKKIELDYQYDEYVLKNAKTIDRRCPDPVESAARFSGWLKGLADCPGMIRLLEKTTSPNGMFSPKTKQNPFWIFLKYSSPQRAERQMWKIRKRANQILEPYGFRVSWKGLARGMSYSGSVGKAAFKSAAETINHFLGNDCRQLTGKPVEILTKGRGIYFLREVDRATRSIVVKMVEDGGLPDIKSAFREFEKYPIEKINWCIDMLIEGPFSKKEFSNFVEAIEASKRLTLDVSDGVVLYLDPTTIEVIHGVECAKGWGRDAINVLLRQQGTGRTFHHYAWHLPAKKLVKDAIAAWRKQAELVKKNSDLVAFLRGEKGFCPLIHRQESYTAGNCRPGTEAWLEMKGWSEKVFVPGEWLIPYLGEDRVRNVATVSFSQHAGR